jgi:hypothetical protein
MKKTFLVVLILSVAALAASSRYVHGRGSATDMDQSRAQFEAMDQAKENIQNACPTENECRPSGPGVVTCTVVISGSCED